ncbi:MAG: NACHT domain-containing protein [Chlorobium sp.]|nr:MAG: NACHT domain-containing protein [Chlorobium sp.]
MRVTSFARIVRVLWLGLFIYAVTVGVGYGKEVGAKSTGVEPAVVSGGVQPGNKSDSLAGQGLRGKQQNNADVQSVAAGMSMGDTLKLLGTIFVVTGGGIWAVVKFIYPEWRRYCDTGKKKKRYHETLRKELGYIRMLGLPGVENVQVNLDDDTFVPLSFFRSQGLDKDYGEGGSKIAHEGELPMTPDNVMQQAFKEQRRMLLVIGDPGAGKTTLLKYYAMCALKQKHLTRLGFSGPVSVFYLPLRDLVRDAKGCYDSLPTNLARWAKKHHQTIQEELFEEWLHRGTSLVLLDGLDEISNTAERREACKWIDTAWSGFSDAYFVVTSRATGYNKDERIEIAAEYERADVKDFTPQQQERFLKNWFTAVFLKEPSEKQIDKKEWQRQQKAKAEEQTRKIVAHLKEDKNKGLRQLAAVPMILQIMAILWKEREFLPKSRVKLYNAVLDYLLELRDERRGIPAILPADDARKVLGPVSLWMQEELNTDKAEKGAMHQKMQERLQYIISAQPLSAEAFCDFLVKRAGLLINEDVDFYEFRHKSFREYLAGVQLVKKVARTTGSLDKLVSVFGVDWWNEPIKFFIAQEDEEIFDLFMEKLLNSPQSEELTSEQQSLLQSIIEEAPLKKVDALCKKLQDGSNKAGRQRVILDCLKAIGEPAALNALQQFRVDGLAKNKDIADRAEEVLLALVDLKRASELQKTKSGEKISSVVTVSRIILKDRQPSFRNPNEHNAEYIRISGGSYIYSYKEKKEQVEDLYVAKYPVTNKLYRSFIASLQAKDSALCAELNTIANNNTWGPGFGNYLEKGNGNNAALFRSGYDEERKFDGEDQPVVAVTWYAAQAYCLWLSLLEGDKALYRLPTEIEWEWVAGGQQGTVGKKVRDYPWPKKRGAPSSKLANFGNNVGATTPVGRYPEGATPEGLYDMAGNVWEWTESLYDENTPKKDLNPARSVRGGSWGYASDYLRCSFRLSIHPVSYWYYDVGFRVVRPSHSLSFGDSENLSI